MVCLLIKERGILVANHHNASVILRLGRDLENVREVAGKKQTIVKQIFQEKKEKNEEI